MPVWGCNEYLSEPRIRQGVRNLNSNQKNLERTTIEGNSPVGERWEAPDILLSTAGHEKSCRKLGGPPSKAKYSWPPIVNKYREGKVKSTPGGEWNRPETVNLQAVEGTIRCTDCVPIEEWAGELI